MGYNDQSLINVVDYTKNKVSWKRSKGSGTNFIGFLMLLASLVTFSIGGVLFISVFFSNNPPSKEIVLGIPIILIHKLFSILSEN